ncbi:MAG: MFS transporter [Anaerorhabdus sp.]
MSRLNKLSKKDMFLIALPGVAMSLMIVVDTGLMKYFTDVLGVSPSIFGRVMSLMIIATIANNLLGGYITDKIGNYAKLIKISLPVIMVLAISIFLIQGTWNDNLIFLSLLVIYFMYDLSKLIFTMNYMSYILNVTSDTSERTEIAAYKSYLGFLPAAINSLIPVFMFTGNYSKETIVTVFITCIIVGFILSMFSLRVINKNMMVNNSKEKRITMDDIIKSLKMIIKSKSFVLYFIVIFIVNGIASAYYTMYLYYMEDVAKAVEIFAALPDILGAIVQFIIFGVSVKFVSKFGSRDSLKIGLLITAVCYVGLAFAPNYYFVTVLYALTMVGIAFFYILQVPLLGTIIDLDELETGKRKSGTIIAINSIIMGMGFNAVNAIFAFILNTINYDGNLVTQSVETVKNLKISIGLFPATALIVAVIMIHLLPLDKKREKEIEEQILAKHNSEQ